MGETEKEWKAVSIIHANATEFSACDCDGSNR